MATLVLQTHGGFGYGQVNKEGEQILDFAERHSLTIVNTNFQKKPEHIITYKFAGRTSQIDFILSDVALKRKLRTARPESKTGRSTNISASHNSGRVRFAQTYKKHCQ